MGVTALRGAETTKRPASFSCTVWRWSGGAVLRREEAHGVHLEPGHYFYEPLDLSDTGPRVLASVNEGFWTNFLRFNVKVDLDPEVVSPSALGNLDFLRAPHICRHFSQLRQSTEVWKNFTIFYVQRTWILRFMGSGFLALVQGVFSDSVHSDVESAPPPPHQAQTAL